MKKILKDKSVWVLSAGCIALCILFVLSRGVFGSQVDWICQHSTLADYFRKHFYQTGELFPDFAWNLGGGQNIYNFAYYGIYSPLILGSYLLPFIPMDICIMGGSILSYVVSVVLFYRWLIEKGISWKHSFSTACMFALATPLIFQFHTQLMFVNYMPFLCMALWGCDRYHQVRKRGMLIIGITGMILSSFYFSMGGLIAIFLYALSECRGKKGTLWGIFWNTGLSVALSGVLLVPTAMAILQGRGGQETGRAAIGILSLPPTRLLYSSYGIGLTAFSLVCLLGCILCAKKWQERILPIGLLIIFSVPVFALVLNGGLYLRDKVFIPFLPLVCLVMAKYLEEKVRRKRDILPYLAVILLLWFGQSNKNFGSYWIWAVADAVLMLLLYLVWQKFPKIPWQILASCVILFFCGWIQNWQEDKILSREEYESITDETKTQAISDILEEDPSLYRLDMVGDGAENKANINRIFDARQRITSVYSSVSNNDYNEFRKNIFRLNEPLRNNMMQSPTDNPCFLSLMGVKYLMGDHAPDGYNLYQRYEDFNLYQSDTTAPLAYAATQVVGEDAYESLTFPDNQTILLQRAVVPDDELKKADSEEYGVLDDTTEKQPVSMQECEFWIPEMDTNDIEIIKKTGKAEGDSKSQDGYEIRTGKEVEIKVPFEHISSDDTMLALSFDVENEKPDQDMHIRLQEQTNRLTARSHLYANHNENFTYMVTVDPDQNEIAVKFGKGKYKISNIRAFMGSMKATINETLYQDPFMLDGERSDGRNMAGNITAGADGYLITSIPYDKNFVVQVDQKKVEIFEVNKAFLGCRLSKGEHEITISYHAPGKTVGLFLSFCALITGGWGYLRKRKDEKKPCFTKKNKRKNK